MGMRSELTEFTDGSCVVVVESFKFVDDKVEVLKKRSFLFTQGQCAVSIGYPYEEEMLVFAQNALREYLSHKTNQVPEVSLERRLARLAYDSKINNDVKPPNSRNPHRGLYGN